MALFAVLALDDSATAVDAAVKAGFPEDSYKLKPGEWLVSADVTTAKQLSVNLGLRNTKPHLVISMRGYTGRAQPDMWEWLAAKWVKTDA